MLLLGATLCYVVLLCAWYVVRGGACATKVRVSSEFLVRDDREESVGMHADPVQRY